MITLQSTVTHPPSKIIEKYNNTYRVSSHREKCRLLLQKKMPVFCGNSFLSASMPIAFGRNEINLQLRTPVPMFACPR